MRWLIVVLLSWVAIARTDRFSLDNIRGPQIGTLLCSEEVREKLSMPYRYLASGRQAYVFLSEDGTSVLKLFRKSYYTLPWYASWLPWKEQEIAKRQKRKSFYLQSYQIAYQELAEETGLLFVGCGFDLPCVRLLDRAHRWHEVDLREVPFVLQKRGEPFVSAALDAAEIKGVIDQFLQQLARRIERGIADGDHDIVHNFGWDQDHLVYLDPGRLFYDRTLQDPMRRQEEWRGGVSRLRKWLAKQCPEMLSYVDEHV